MARLRFWSVAVLALALTGNASQTGRTQLPSMSSSNSTMSIPNQTTASPAGPTASSNCSCVIYALSDHGFDADLGKWIAETLKEMVEPRSWQGSCSLRYYAPKNILVINNSSAVHAKIDNFLKEVKTKMPKEKTAHTKTTKNPPRDLVVPAAYRQVNLPPEPSAYPVPAPVKTPKHLFHFLIRYEGEGIIDDNVVKYMKVQNQAEKSEKKSENNSTSGFGASPPLRGGETTNSDKSNSGHGWSNDAPAAIPQYTRGQSRAECIPAPSAKKQEEKKDEPKKDEPKKDEEKKDVDKKEDPSTP